MSGDAHPRTVPRTTDEARAEIERAREQIQSSVLALREEMSRVGRAVDFRQWVRRRPALCLGVAFGLGFYLGSRKW